MGKAQSKAEECESEEFKEVKRLVEEKGVAGAQALMREKLESWKDVEIKIGVTGNAGVGKSSFINTFRGIDDEDDQAAGTDVVDKTSEPVCYTYPDSPKIKLMDLPGIGTPTYPDFDTYSKEVGLETYDAFFILTATRFTHLELELAKKIKSMEKSFFLVRTKIDIDEMNDSRKKSHNIEKMLGKIRAYCYERVESLEITEDDIFLISNHNVDKWDFSRLVEAILQKLPTHQKEALTLSLKVLSKNVVKRKIKAFKSRVWMVTLLFMPAIPLDLLTNGFVSYCIETAEVKRRIKSYRSQLGLPEEDSDEFNMMKPEFQARMRDLYPKKDGNFWTRYFQRVCVTPAPILGVVFSRTVTDCLHNMLDDMENLSLDILAENAGENMGTD